MVLGSHRQKIIQNKYCLICNYLVLTKSWFCFHWMTRVLGGLSECAKKQVHMSVIICFFSQKPMLTMLCVKYVFLFLRMFCVSSTVPTNLCCRAVLSAGLVLSASFLPFYSSSFSSFIRLCIKRGGLAVCAVGGSCVSVLFCSFIGWGCKWKALCSRSPLFLSSWVLTFSLYLSLSLSPSRTTH